MSGPLRVAVIGASGIGQHHARWYHLAGCEVVAFAGTSEASCEKTRVRLAGYFGFDGRAYWDVPQLLREEAPDIVDVSSPFHLHREHAIAALEAGAHVLCEKPLCWDDDKDDEEILADGQAVVEAARRAGRLLGVSAQYPAVIPTYRAFHEKVLGPMEKVNRVYMEMEVKGRKGPKSYEEIWTDRITHPLSLVIGFLPGGQIDYDSVRCVIAERENRVQFDYLTPSGRCAVEVIMRDIDEGTPVRRFGVNDFLVDWLGYPDEQGIYRAALKYGQEEVRCNDFLHALIERFASAVQGKGGPVVVTGEEGLLNLEYQAALLRLAERA